MSARHLTLLGRLAEINWFIIFIMSSIAAIGFAMMVSAGGGDFHPWASQQMSRFALAFVIMLVLAMIPMRILMDYAYIFYFLCLLVLLGVDIMGHIGMGAKRWLTLGGLNLQPSEFMKLAVIMVLARYFHQLHPEDIQRFPFLIPPLILIAMPAVLILRQPNLGTTIIMGSVGVIMCFLAGVRWRYFIGAAVAGLSALPLVWHFMHDYQKRRVLTFLDPDQDPQGAGYNILQSIIAIGSGGLLGKGYMHGSQNQLNFLPEKHTDFIFTMLAEEFGFIGCMVVLLLFFVLLMSGMMISLRSRSTFGAMVAAGVTALIFMHLLINCSMVMGMMPVVGVPLPLMSYGGSIMVSTVLAVGLLLNSYTYRDNLPLRMTPKL
ncbi:MAG: rod shape-determining protein RodA [Rickettsiales bacterium]|nr:rod shape-determining protein RodA [Rickettsiales bacterium]